MREAIAVALLVSSWSVTFCDDAESAIRAVAPQKRAERLVSYGARRGDEPPAPTADLDRRQDRLPRSAREASAGRRLDSSSSIACLNSPGNDATKPLAGAQAFQALGGAAGATLASDAESPVEVVNGCPFHYHLLKGDSVHISVVRPTTTSILWVEWDHDIAFAVAIMSWSANGHPIYEVFGRSNFDLYIWDYSLQGEVVYRGHPDNKDFFHCNRGCNTHRGIPHAGETGRLWVTLDTQFEGDADTVFTGSWRLHFRETSNAMAAPQYMALQRLFLETCSPHRNGTLSSKPWVTSWTWAQHQVRVSADPEKKPYCDWLQRTGWPENMFETLEDTENGPCGQLEHVLCDDDKNVIFIDLQTAGLRGTLTDMLSLLTALQKLRLPYNQLEGSLPVGLLRLTSLEEVVLHHNSLKGQTPCFTSRNLQRLLLDWNPLTGTLPRCVGQLPSLERFSCNHCHLHGALPTSLGYLQRLVAISISSNVLNGSIPAELCGLRDLSFVDFSKNRFEGTLPPGCFSETHRLYALRLSYNHLTGTLPALGAEMTAMKVLDLAHNNLDGAIHNQLQVMAENAHGGLHSEVHLNDNSFSGKLPKAVYSLLMGAHPIRSLDMSDNYFRCEIGGGWEQWARRLPSELSKSLGKCMPVPTPEAVEPIWGFSGEEFEVHGSNFIRAEPRCQFWNASFEKSVPAVYVTDRRLRCYAPSGVAAGQYHVTVSNFGEDFASPETVVGYVDLRYDVAAAPVLLVENPRVTMRVRLLGVGLESFFEPGFREALATSLGVATATIIIDEVRLVDVGQSHDSKNESDLGGGGGAAGGNTTLPPGTDQAKPSTGVVELAFAVQVGGWTEAQQIDSRLSELSANGAAELTRVFDQQYTAEGFYVEVVNGPDTEALGPPPTKSQDGKSSVGAWGIAGIVLLILVVCGCGCFALWLIRREKAGHAYFLEETEDPEEVNNRAFSITPTASDSLGVDSQQRRLGWMDSSTTSYGKAKASQRDAKAAAADFSRVM